MPSEDSKPVKKVLDEDDEQSIATAFGNRKKKSADNSNAISKSQSKVKKEENKVKRELDDEEFEEPTSKKTSRKADNKQEKKKGAKASDKGAKKRERKVYDLPGQKRDSPEERDPLRIFYETLYEQVPSSEMAAIWMMESGLLPKEEAKKVFEKKQKKGQEQSLGSPMKSVVTVKKKADSIIVKKKSLTSPVSTQKKKTPDSKVASKQRKSHDISSDNEWDDDFVTDAKKAKKQRAS
ncbi:uncharacterized protein LOC111392168 isoform X2 [Olea europaea var. sylvestris]|uniref:uncharacterized protein LOC111392168 isoform X2 n=1 Tax=Olea europaea var. sylvestris TaxID=158386 RepID=UPI000C1CF40D|nr:uncharacterized protein LOC111392168 isoform X2 [Olea europaea var. sylvestris]